MSIYQHDSNADSMESEKVVSHAFEHRVLDATREETLELIRHAQQADAADKLLTIREALSKYKKAVFWAMFLSTSLIMEGYDLVIVRGFLCTMGDTRSDGLIPMYRSIRSTGNHNFRTNLASPTRTQGKRPSLQPGNRDYQTLPLLVS